MSEEIPFAIEHFDDFCASLLSYDLRITGRRFDQVAGQLVERREKYSCDVCGHERPNPEYEYAQFGEAFFEPKDKCIMRVQKVTILFARISRPPTPKPRA